MLNMFLYVSTGIVIFAYVGYLLLLLLAKNKIVSKDSGFDVTKDIISEYNRINIIENSGHFTIYNLKRKVIKLAKDCYYGKDLSAIALSLQAAGESVVDNKGNMYINMFRIFFSNLKILYIFPILSLVISNSSFSQSDAKISIIFLLLNLLICYFLIDIKNSIYNWSVDNLAKIKAIDKENREKIMRFLNRLLLLDKCIFFGELIMLGRLILIILEIN